MLLITRWEEVAVIRLARRFISLGWRAEGCAVHIMSVLRTPSMSRNIMGWFI